MEIRMRADGAVITESEFRSQHRNTSFPPQLSAELLNDFGADVVFEGPQAQPTRYQTAFRDGVQQINGKWFTKYSVADLDADAIAAKDAEQAKAVRATRNQMLKDSDWTQVIDAPFTQSLAAEWQSYRQALRDISLQDGFPWEVTWPAQP